jgi:eukaryotic-like serine/threonine-protein kinase
MLGLSSHGDDFRMAIDGNTLPLPDAAISYREGDIVGGKYRLERVLGEGGMGTVWAARNTALDSLVAVKLIAGTDRATLSARLLKEARAAARLRHPAIVRVFDVGETQHGDPFIVMELLEGMSLADRLTQDTTLEPTLAVRLLLPIAEALSHAHVAHIVHRDLKPDNIFIVEEGGRIQPKLLDFGIVQVGMGPNVTRLTEDGEFIGTPAYMSPEQARGAEDIDPTTDVWAFCVVLYECLSGRLPFDSENYNALMREIIEDMAPILAELGAADAGLSSIVEIGMAKQPNRRWSSMNALGAALAQWLIDRGVEEDATLKPLRSGWALGSAKRAAPAIAVPKIETPQARDVLPKRGMVFFLAVGAALAAFGIFIGSRSTRTPSASEPPRVVGPVRSAQIPNAERSDPPQVERILVVPTAPSAPAVETSSPAAPRSSTAPRVPRAASRPSAVPAASAGKDPLDLVEPY